MRGYYAEKGTNGWNPQNREVNDVKRRSADSKGGRRRREIVRSLRDEAKKNGQSIVGVMRKYRICKANHEEMMN